jgi:6-phosphogluconolactonase
MKKLKIANKQQMDHIHIFDSPENQATALAEIVEHMIIENLKNKDRFSIALSGGTTPISFFHALADQKASIPWDRVDIFWVDERCVPPDDRESNYGMTKKHFLNKIRIPSENINRIFGEAEPENEAKRYSQRIKQKVFLVKNWPVFDWILLGLGEDGHTASLFPGSPVLENFDEISDIAIHPLSGQRRITLTLPVLNRARVITFLVTGSSKTLIIGEILKKPKAHTNYPANKINPLNGTLEWYLDAKSAAELY